MSRNRPNTDRALHRLCEPTDEHCWHHIRRRSDGTGNWYEDEEMCCHCGDIGTRRFKKHPDPAHGPFAQQWTFNEVERSSWT